jgi:hypothetical protein
MTARRVLAVAAALAIAIAGCADAPPPSAAPTPTRQPDPTPITTTYELATTVWYEGLLVHVDRATAILDSRGGPVEVEIRIENAGLEIADLNAPIRLVIDGAPVDPTRESRVPEIPAETTVTVTMRYELQGVSSVDDAVLQVGADPLHLARVPMTPEAGDPVVLQPITLDVSGQATANDLRLRLRGGEVRWDLPDWSEELDAEHLALTLTYSITYLGEFSGGYAFTGDNVHLRLPDGSVVNARRDGHSQSVALIAAGKTVDALVSRFEIPADMPGRYALFVKDAGKQTGIVFTIGG